jgi:hypothetical protein
MEEIVSTLRAAEIRARLAEIGTERAAEFAKPGHGRWNELVNEEFRLEDELVLEERPFRQKRCFQLMLESGITRAVAHYHGGHDEGWVEEIEWYGEDGERCDPPDAVQHDGTSDLIVEIERPVYDKYRTFAFPFTVRGFVEWNAIERTCVMDGEEETMEPVYEDLTEEVR